MSELCDYSDINFLLKNIFQVFILYNINKTKVYKIII